MGYTQDRVRIWLARRLVDLAKSLTAAMESKHRANVAKLMVHNAMMLPHSGTVTTKKRD